MLLSSQIGLHKAGFNTCTSQHRHCFLTSEVTAGFPQHGIHLSKILVAFLSVLCLCGRQYKLGGKAFSIGKKEANYVS